MADVELTKATPIHVITVTDVVKELFHQNQVYSQ